MKAYALARFLVVKLFFVVFPSGFRRPAHEPHIPTAHTLLPQQRTVSSDGFRPDWWIIISFCCCDACSLLLRYRLLQHLLLSICHPKGAMITPVIAWQGLPMLQQESSFIPGSTTTHESERRCNFGSEDVPCLGQLHDLFTGGSVRTEPGMHVETLSAWRRRQGVSSVHPQRATKALTRLLHRGHDAERKLILAASSRSAQAKSQRAEARAEAFTL